MPGDGRATSHAADLETLRILREYRRLVLLGRARLPLAEARRLVGPDCAFHLYFRHAARPEPARGAAAAGGGGRQRKPRGRRRR